jgi:hypothetical protein
MATRYVRSTDGSNADNGTTWALAKLDLAGVSAITVAGDVIYVSQVHAETTAGAITINWNGTVAAPVRILCGNDAAQPPTAGATTATVTTTGAGAGMTLGGSVPASFNVAGITFNCGSGANNMNLSAGSNGSSGHRQVYESCNFKMVASGATCLIVIGGGIYINCGFQFAAAGQKFNAGAGGSNIRGGGIIAGGTSPTFVFDFTSTKHFVEGFDFSACSAGVHLCDITGASAPAWAMFRNCKLPASWSGSLVQTPASMHPEATAEMINCSAGAQNYKYWKQTRFGSVRDETTIVHAGGASDGATTLTWKMVAASPVFPNSALQSADIFQWNATVGSPVTATIEVVNDGATLKDDELWIEVEYLGSSAAPVSTHTTDRRAIIATAANQTSSSATWTTTGLASPIKQKLDVTFTPQMAGFVVARVMLAKASATVYVDPKVTLT